MQTGLKAIDSIEIGRGQRGLYRRTVRRGTRFAVDTISIKGKGSLLRLRASGKKASPIKNVCASSKSTCQSNRRSSPPRLGLAAMHLAVPVSRWASTSARGRLDTLRRSTKMLGLSAISLRSAVSGREAYPATCSISIAAARARPRVNDEFVEHSPRLCVKADCYLRAAGH